MIPCALVTLRTYMLNGVAYPWPLYSGVKRDLAVLGEELAS